MNLLRNSNKINFGIIFQLRLWLEENKPKLHRGKAVDVAEAGTKRTFKAYRKQKKMHPKEVFLIFVNFKYGMPKVVPPVSSIL